MSRPALPLLEAAHDRGNPNIDAAVDDPGVIELPHGWSKFIHPSGYAYYFHPQARLHTRLDPRLPGVPERLLSIASLLFQTLPAGAAAVNIQISVLSIQDGVVEYYMIDHGAHRIFWTHEPHEPARADLGIIQEYLQSRLLPYYWAHVEQYPVGTPDDVAAENKLLRTLRLGQIPGYHHLTPWLPEQCSELIIALDAVLATNLGYRNATVGRLWRRITTHQQHWIRYGPLAHRARARLHGPFVLIGRRQFVEFGVFDWVMQFVSRLMLAESDVAAHQSAGQSSTMPGSFPDTTDMIIRISPKAIAKGGFAEVFEAIHSNAGKVALKRLKLGNDDDEAVLRRFEREANTWRSLKHPHILKFIGTLRRDGHLYFVSPFMKNGTLSEYVGIHPDVNRIKLLCEAAEAIAWVHTCELVHGDIKANNILIDDNGHSLLCDFGLVTSAQSKMSTALRRAGTFRWQSPELFLDEPRTSASDVYAFGMTVAEVLTGKIPFPHLQTDAAVMCAIMVRGERPSRDPAASSTGVSYETVWDIAADCWAPEPERRINMAEHYNTFRFGLI